MWKFEVVALCVCLSAVCATARASDGEVVHHLALFEIASDGVHDDLARDLGTALREAVRATPGHQLTEARVSLEQLSLVHDCDPQELSCLGRIANKLGVEGFIFGQLENQGSGAYAKLELFDASSGSIRRTAQVTFAVRDVGDGEVQSKADTLVAQLLSDPAATLPQPTSVEPVSLDNVAVLEADGGMSSKRVAGYALLGGAALSVGLSVLAFVQIDRAQTNESLDLYRRAVGKMDPNVEDACDEAEQNKQHGLNSERFAEVKDQCSTGRTFEVLQFVFLGAAAVSGGLSAYFLLSDDGREQRPRARLDNLPLRPIIRHNAAELRAKFRF
ncbi:MAG TPA: hypothetical protein VJR89_13835 [Polyangiales bacterium]|nr:hypothetical protein [Polyangiales bacterium]